MGGFGLTNGADIKYPEGAANVHAQSNVQHGRGGASCRFADALVFGSVFLARSNIHFLFSSLLFSTTSYGIHLAL